MTGTDLYKRTHKSVPVIFEPPCIYILYKTNLQLFVLNPPCDRIAQCVVPETEVSYYVNKYRVQPQQLAIKTQRCLCCSNLFPL